MRLLELRRIVRTIVSERLSEEPIETPSYHDPHHKLGMEVPKGGSSCASCRYVSEDGMKCGNPGFQAWQTDEGVEAPERLPAPADSYCCDNWTPKT